MFVLLANTHEFKRSHLLLIAGVDVGRGVFVGCLVGVREGTEVNVGCGVRDETTTVRIGVGVGFPSARACSWLRPVWTSAMDLTSDSLDSIGNSVSLWHVTL